jgi:hypothetical protein
LQRAVERATSALLGNLEPVDHMDPDVIFEIVKTSGKLTLFRNREPFSSPSDRAKTFFHFFDNILRISVAEYAKNLVFLHAGVVGAGKRAILLPAQSFKGKSTLVTELVRAGANYYSDDFAILDEHGLVHAFPRMISMRACDGQFTPYEVPHQEIGPGPEGAIPVGMIFLTEYRFRARWRPQVLSRGAGVLATLPFALQIQRDPELCLRVLNKVATSAIIAKSERGDASRTAKLLLEFLEMQEQS